MLTSRKLFTATVATGEDNNQALAAAYSNLAKAPGATAGELGDPLEAQHFNDLIRNIETVVKAAGLDLRTEDVSTTVTVGTGANQQTVSRRNAILARAIITLAGAQATSSFFGLGDTPASAAGIDDGTPLVVSGGKVIAQAIVANLRIEDRPPNLTDGPGQGRMWSYAGHNFLYRGVVDTNHIWDVAGVWACANLAADGTQRSNGIYPPDGYLGDGWARFTAANRQTRGVYPYTMRGTGGENNYVVTVTPDYSATTRGLGRPADNRENVGVIEKTQNSFKTAFGHEERGVGNDAPHGVLVVRCGTA